MTHAPYLGTWQDADFDEPAFLRRPRTLPPLDVEDLHTGIGEVRFVDDGQPVPDIHIYTPAGRLRWTSDSPTRAGFYYVRLVGTADYDAIRIDPSFTYDSTLEFCGPLPLPPEDQ